MPPAATAAARSHLTRPARSPAPRTARRVSGPVPVAAPLVGPRGSVLAPPLGLRVARRVVALGDARVLDRLVRGRLWIALLAAGLVGIVFMQISLLKLNTGISRAVQTAQTLEGQNTELKLELSRLGGGERVQESAAAMGFVDPVVGRPRFLDAAKADAGRAAANITPPAPIQQLPLGMIPPAEGGTAGVMPPPGILAPTPVATVPPEAGAPTGAAAAEGDAPAGGHAHDPPAAKPSGSPVEPAAAPAAAPATAPSTVAGGLPATPQG